MKNEDRYPELSEEVKQKLISCKTPEEMREVLAEAGVGPLEDEMLDGASGGMRDPWFCDKCDKCGKKKR